MKDYGNEQRKNERAIDWRMCEAKIYAFLCQMDYVALLMIRILLTFLVAMCPTIVGDRQVSFRAEMSSWHEKLSRLSANFFFLEINPKTL